MIAGSVRDFNGGCPYQESKRNCKFFEEIV